MTQFAVLSGALVAACARPVTTATRPACPAVPSQLAVQKIALPGAPADGVYMDYVAYDRAHHRVWIPAGNTGSVDVIDTDSAAVRRIEGFAIDEQARRDGTKRVVGPSSVTVGDGVVYVGNRADHEVCAIDEASLRVGACVSLASMPDGIQYVAATHEVWVTTPRDDTITILRAPDPATLELGEVLHFDGQPECYQVDESRGVFYTNLEDRDKTLQIDLRTHEVRATWEPHCGEDGPKGIGLDHEHDLLLIACDDHVVLMDAAHDGAILWQVFTGEGVDNIDYVESRHELYAAAAGAAKLTIARLDPDQRAFVETQVVATHEGARNAVGTDEGDVYVPDTREGAVLLVTRRSTDAR